MWSRPTSPKQVILRDVRRTRGIQEKLTNSALRTSDALRTVAPVELGVEDTAVLTLHSRSCSEKAHTVNIISKFRVFVPHIDIYFDSMMSQRSLNLQNKGAFIMYFREVKCVCLLDTRTCACTMALSLHKTPISSIYLDERAVTHPMIVAGELFTYVSDICFQRTH